MKRWAKIFASCGALLLSDSFSAANESEPHTTLKGRSTPIGPPHQV